MLHKHFLCVVCRCLPVCLFTICILRRYPGAVLLYRRIDLRSKYADFHYFSSPQLSPNPFGMLNLIPDALMHFKLLTRSACIYCTPI